MTCDATKLMVGQNLSKGRVKMITKLARQKAARTRRANNAARKRWLEVDKPSYEATVALCNRSLATKGVRVRFTPQESGLTLKSGSSHGILMKVLGTGLTWRVLVDGYKNPREYYAGFWEIV